MGHMTCAVSQTAGGGGKHVSRVCKIKQLESDFRKPRFLSQCGGAADASDFERRDYESTSQREKLSFFRDEMREIVSKG